MNIKMLLFLCAILIISLTACSQIEDTNGDDTTLVTIDDEKLASTSISSSGSGVSSNSVRNNITLINSDEEIDFDSLTMDGGPISGVSDIMATGLEEGQYLAIYVESEIREGNLEIVLLSPDNEILYHFDTNGEDVVEIPLGISGTYNVRIGVESFIGNIYVERIIE